MLRNVKRKRESSENVSPFHLFTFEFVYKDICKLNPAKSNGLDKIPDKFLRDGGSKDPLAHIINSSICSSSASGSFREILKQLG